MTFPGQISVKPRQGRAQNFWKPRHKSRPQPAGNRNATPGLSRTLPRPNARACQPWLVHHQVMVLVCCSVSICKKQKHKQNKKKKTMYRISFIKKKKKKKIAKIDKVKTTTVASHRVEFCKKSAGNRKDDLSTSFTPTNIVVVGQRNAIFICIFRSKIEGNYLSSSHFKSCRRTTYPLATSRDFKSKICDLHI